MLRRTIPSSGQALPVVGLGTWIQFDVDPASSEVEDLKEVLRTMHRHGGKIIDSSPMYGRSEGMIGRLTRELNLQDEFFYATKVWTSGRSAGIQQMEQSMRLMGRQTMDLMQIHNLMDWETHIRTLKDWKAAGKIKYFGITHYTDSAHSRLQKIIRSEPELDFVQCNYSINDRHAEDRLLPMAKDYNVAVIINRPYAGGALFRKIRGRDLPAWAAECDINSWGQFFLKYLLGNPAVTCVIPGTSNPQHLADNMGAATGRLPDQAFRARMVAHFRGI